jgi:hypothetical protein
MEEEKSDAELVKAIVEIKNTDNDISQVFVFKKKEIIAKDNCVNEKEANNTIEAFEALSNRAYVIGGIESVTIQGANGRVDINQFNDFYSTIVTSKNADGEKVNSLTHVLAPTIFKKLQNKNLTPNKSLETLQPPNELAIEKSQIPIFTPTKLVEISPPALEYGEFIVDSMGRLEALSISPDTIKLDVVTVGRWTELFGENKINKVQIRVADTGKTLECMYETSIDPKHQRGSVLLPEPVQRKLQVKKGSKILLKPIIKQELPEETFERKLFNENRTAEQPATAINSPSILETEYSEFAVEDAGRLGIITLSSDAVKLSIIAFGHWTELYGRDKFHSVMLKDPGTGKTIECKFEITKDPKHERKSVLLSDSIQRKLQTKKGSKILIKPIIWEESTKENLENESPNQETTQEQNKAKSKQLQPSKTQTITEHAKNPLPIEPNLLFNPQNCQMMVKDVSSFGNLRGSDTVHIDANFVMRWKESYGEIKINEVTISDPLLGKSVQCKFKIETDPKSKGNGQIQITKSIQKELSVKEGSLVIVKPVLK